MVSGSEREGEVERGNGRRKRGAYGDIDASFVRGWVPLDGFMAKLLDSFDDYVQSTPHRRHGADDPIILHDPKHQLLSRAMSSRLNKIQHLLFLLAPPWNLMHERIIQPRLLC
jgi:hypothetical protein